MWDMKKLVIIPAFNESSNIINTINDIKENAPSFDYVVINDQSSDETQKILNKNNIPVINLPVNLGIGGAVQTGYMYALRKDYDIAVQFDGDGQHDAKYLDMMAKTLVDENVDMVIGSRFIENKGFLSTSTRRLGIKYFTGLIKLVTGETIKDPTSGYRAISRRAIEHFVNLYPRDFPEPEVAVYLVKNKMKIVEVPVVMRERQGGESSIHPFKAAYYMIKVTFAIILEGGRHYADS